MMRYNSVTEGLIKHTCWGSEEHACTCRSWP
jgi:hypothetical protein